MKGRTCANGSKQRMYLKEGESVASPTCALESIIHTCIVDAYEGRSVAVFDIPGAYLHSDIPEDELLLMVIRDKFVDMIWGICPDFDQHV